MGDLTWTRHESGVMCGLTQPMMPQCERAYIFDLENTLIVVKNATWKWWHPSVPEKLCELNKIASNCIIISHDAKRNSDETTVLKLLNGVATQLNLPVCVLVTFQAKPRTKMWDLFTSHVMPECLHHLVVGHTQQKLVNYKFATNLGCPFKTPQEFFLNAPVADLPRLKNWSEWLDNQVPLDSSKWGPREQQEVVLLVGRPTSGKTTLATQVFLAAALGETRRQYDILSLDTLGTVAKMGKAAKAALESGSSVVVDAMNATTADRKRYIDVAGVVPVRAIVMAIADDVATQLNAYRGACGGKRVSALTVNNFFSKYEPPTIEEGICEIHTVTSFITMSMNERALFCTQW